MAAEMATTQESPPAFKFVGVSYRDGASSVHILPSDQVVNINGENMTADKIKIDDNVSFEYLCGYHNIMKNATFIVKFLTRLNTNNFTCFLGDCTVITPDGEDLVKNLIVGKSIMKPDGTMGEIKCILKTDVSDSDIVMCYHPGGLTITPYHPVKIIEWEFPINYMVLFQTKIIHGGAVYSIGLEDGSSFMVNGIEVIGLGHNIQNDPVASHEFFGEQKVIDNIMKLSPGGYLSITSDWIDRDPDTGLVNGISPP